MNTPIRIALIFAPDRRLRRDALREIARYARVHGPWVFYHQEEIVFKGVPDWLRSWQGDGIIARIQCDEMADFVLASGLPAVDVCGLCPRDGIASIDMDCEVIGRMAAEHFLDRGFEHLAFYGVRNAEYSKQCQAAFTRRACEAGFEPGAFLRPRARERIRSSAEVLGLNPDTELTDWLAGLPKPVGLFVCSDFRARQVLEACRKASIAVPDQVAVLGISDDDVLCELCNPPLSSIDINGQRIGYAAASLLDRQLRGEPPPEAPIVVGPLKIVTRRSSDVLAVGDPDVAEALRFIREHACEAIGVDDVRQHVRLPRRTLERRFKRRIGRSPHALIQQARLQQAKQYLVETDFSLAQIAALVGFEQVESMSKFFKSQTGQTPGQYRKKNQHPAYE